MANYQGLNCIMPEIMIMASETTPQHERHIHEYFNAMEKYVRTAVPQLITDYLEQFQERLVVEFETYFNGEKMHHADIAKAIAEIIAESVDAAIYNLKIVI